MPSAVARRRQGFETEVEIREHRLIADEPEDKGGGDAGPTATELLAASLATCTVVTVLMYAERKGWELGDLEASVGFETPSVDSPARFNVEMRTPAALDDDQRERILTIAAKCPVHRTLAAQDVRIEDSLRLMEA
ncbi:MAG: OsmC family protein [Actinobacteria bacterium]|nr:OsmC family protein [Actinomycetota bacterium]